MNYTELGRLTSEEEKQLALQMRNSSLPQEERKKARDLFITSYIPLVKNIAKKYSSNGNLEDLISAGNLGLVKAADKFDPTRGNRFSTYATWCIRKEIFNYLALFKYNMPKNKCWAGRSLFSLIDEYFYNNDQINFNDFMSLISKQNKIKNINKRNIYPNLFKEITFLRYRNSKDYENLKDYKEKSPEEIAVSKDLLKLILLNLNKRELDIIKSRFGIGTEKQSLESISKKFEISEQRVNQIELAALKKIRKLLL